MARRRKNRITETNANDTFADVVISDDRLINSNEIIDDFNKKAKAIKSKARRGAIQKGLPYNLVTKKSSTVDKLEVDLNEYIGRLERATKNV